MDKARILMYLTFIVGSALGYFAGYYRNFQIFVLFLALGAAAMMFLGKKKKPEQQIQEDIENKESE